MVWGMATDILYLVSRLRPSGPTNQLYYILKSLDDELNPIILTLSPEIEESELPKFRDLGVRYETLGLSTFGGFIRGPRRVKSFADSVSPDVVQTQGLRADVLSSLFLSEYDRITTVRNYPYDDYPSKFGALQGNIMAWSHLRAYNRIDQLVACSETISSRIGDRGIGTRVIQNGVDVEHFTPTSAPEKRRLRAQLNIDPEKTVFTSVGTLIPRKDPKTVIEGYKQADLRDSTLLFLGDGPLREEAEKLASGDGSIRFEGWVDNVNQYLQASDCFISASRSEGLPNTVMEALSAGLPVCLSDIGPHREIIQYNDEAGRLFEKQSAEELSICLAELAESDLAGMSDLARGIVEDHLSAERMANEYMELYRRMVDQGKSTRQIS